MVLVPEILEHEFTAIHIRRFLLYSYGPFVTDCKWLGDKSSQIQQLYDIPYAN